MKISYIYPFLFVIILVTLVGSASAQMSITSVSPAKGSVGDIITIKGNNFNLNANDNIISFGASRASIISASADEISVAVPYGATYAPIVLLNKSTGLSVMSTAFFTPTSFPNKGSITADDFSQTKSYSTSDGPSSVVLHDLDGNGKPDIIITGTINNVVSIRLNTSAPGAISFASKADFLVGTTPMSVAVADFDGDGKPDLVTAHINSNNIIVLRNTSTVGSLSFTRLSFNVGRTTDDVTSADYDGDGKLDIAVTGSDGLTSVFRNTSNPGNINFAPKIDFATGYMSSSIVTGDIDGDGKYDIVTMAFTGRMSVLRNTSNIGVINFAAKVDFETNTSPTSFTIGDYDGDGRLDLAVPNSGTVSFLRNLSSIGSIKMAPMLTTPIGIVVRGIASGDIDGDGKVDLASANWSAPLTDRVSILRNISDIGTINTAPKVSLQTGTPYDVAIGDLDMDGRPELVIANNSGGGVTVFLNKPKIIIQATDVQFSNISTSSTDINWTNGDGDGRTVFVKLATNQGAANPQDGTVYSADHRFKLGEQIGTSGWYAVYHGNGNSVQLSGLEAGTSYEVMVCEYKFVNGSPAYLTAASTGNPASFQTISNDASLASLNLDQANLDQPFSPTNLDYTVNVPNVVQTLSFTPLANLPDANVTVNGTPLPRGNKYNAQLIEGQNLININVTAPDGVTTRVYSVVVNRLAAPNPYLYSLNISSGQLEPVFNQNILSYDLHIDNSIQSIKLIPTAASAGSKIVVNDVAVVSGNETADLPMDIGANYIKITVTASDNITKLTYQLNIYRAKAEQVITFKPIPIKFPCNVDFFPEISSNNIHSPISLSSSNTAVAVINPNGSIKIVGIGQSTLIATQAEDHNFKVALPKSQVLEVTSPPVPNVTIKADRLRVCPGDPVVLSAEVSNLSGNLSYQWQVNGVNLGTTSSITVFPTNAQDVYRCTIINNSGCNASGTSNSLSFNIDQPIRPQITIASSSNNPICPNETVTFTAQTVNQGNNPVYQWKINGVNVGLNSRQLVSSEIKHGDIVSCLLTNNDGGCSSNIPVSSNTITVNIFTPPQLSLTLMASKNPIYEGEQVTFSAATNLNGNIKYRWQINGIAQIESGALLSRKVSDGDVVTCKVSVDSPCGELVAERSIRMEILPKPKLKIPNAFSPNGDGINDYWVITIPPDSRLSLQIFNRNGVIVYQTNNYDGRWDGSYKGKTLAIGVYYYVAKLSSEQTTISGSVTILR